MAATQVSRSAYSRKVHESFSLFRAELDEYQDHREAVIKTSRDITALSKKVIFALHRITTRPADAVLAEGEKKLKEILVLFEKISALVQGDDFFRYQRSVSPGIQEFIEAASFLHFLRTRKLVTLEEIQDSVSTPEGKPYVEITPEDFLLGLADLTGELMRYAINAIGTGQPAVATEVATFLRLAKAEFDPLVPSVRFLHKKMGTMEASLRKIEDASYTLTVRGAEYGGAPEHLMDYLRRLTSSDDSAKHDPREADKDFDD